MNEHGTSQKRKFGFWFLISICILLAIMLILGQTLSLINYDLTVSLGLQESAEEVSDVGVAWAKGFAFGDTVFYLPLLLLGIIGLLKRRSWDFYSMFGALAITVYWPIVSLSTIFMVCGGCGIYLKIVINSLIGIINEYEVESTKLLISIQDYVRFSIFLHYIYLLLHSYASISFTVNCEAFHAG